ncbi:MAG: histidine ammonia-lyase [Nitrospirae bacterium]|nr:histidine ammonia-lyase [Nitrospirota bacterium]
MKSLYLGTNISIEDLKDVVFKNREVQLSPEAYSRMAASNMLVAEMAKGERLVYGVNTGLGKLADKRISYDDIKRLQINLIRSHAAGIGEPLGGPETRAILLLRANVLAKGYSGVRPAVVETLIEMLNRSVHPIIPCRGSVGASGDLAPLAHLALVLIGEGEAIFNGLKMPGIEAMSKAGISVLELEAKEGLSLVNGTQVMLALGLLSMISAERLLDAADVAGALTLEALKGTPVAFDKRVQELRPYSGQILVAERIRGMLEGSEIRRSHLECDRVQDPYSLRCIPQVHGAIRDSVGFGRKTLETEINSVTDNPIVFPDDGDIISAGNFHGQPIAIALDLMAIVMAELGSISERRIERLVSPEYGDLPPFLTKNPGLNSGFMVAQVSAAALASENKVLSHPASVDSIPTSGNKEDHVSMGMGAALKLKDIIRNVEWILAIELLAASQGIDLLSPLRPGIGTRRAYELIRGEVPMLEEDRVISKDIEKISGLISKGVFSSILD